MNHLMDFRECERASMSDGVIQDIVIGSGNREFKKERFSSLGGGALVSFSCWAIHSRNSLFFIRVSMIAVQRSGHYHGF